MKIRHFLFALSAFFVGLNPLVVSSQGLPLPKVVLGIQTDSDVALFDSFIDSTVVALNKAIGKDNVKIVRLEKDALIKLVREGGVDFLITDADFVGRYEATDRLRTMASLWPKECVGPTEVTGALYFTRKDNKNINTIDQLSRVSLAAGSAESFSGWLVAIHDIFKRGYAPDTFFEKRTFYGDNPLEVIKAVEQKKAHAGVIPVCAFERLAKEGKVNRKDYKFLNTSETSLSHCAASTSLYPGLFFSATSNAGESIITKTSNLIRNNYSITPRGTWTRPVSNRLVHDLFFDLKIGPYSHLSAWTLEKFIREHSGVFVAFLLFIAMVLTYSAIISFVVRSRTAQLKKAIDARDEIAQVASRTRERIANLERAGVVGQMSTMIAHELKQPIGAITNFANGLLRRINRGEVDREVLLSVLKEIVEQGSRASEIVNRVRSYAKRKVPNLVQSDLSEAVENAIKTFRHSKRSEARLIEDVPPYLWAEIDPWEIELAVYNILKNAADSVAGLPDAQIQIRVYAYEDYWRIEVADNGPKITQESVDRFMMLFVTTKESGLGLGLSLVSTIAERNNGFFNGRANPERGVTITLDIPRAEIKHENNNN